MSVLIHMNHWLARHTFATGLVILTDSLIPNNAEHVNKDWTFEQVLEWLYFHNFNTTPRCTYVLIYTHLHIDNTICVQSTDNIMCAPASQSVAVDCAMCAA